MAWLLRGLHPDLRAGETKAACLLFDVERLFEAFVGAVVRRRWRGG
jgi:5-methylcytosine-specific restriction enzyme subunit McrC